MHALDHLEKALNYCLQNLPPMRVGGTVTEVTPAYYRVSGLSQFLKLGECVSFDVEGRRQIGEVVRIDKSHAVVKPFEPRCDAGLGTIAYRMGPVSLAPDASWKGRVINALGAPIDGGPQLGAGERFRSVDAEPPVAMRRARVSKPLKTGVRLIDCFRAALRGAAHRNFRRLRRRQIDLARHACKMPGV